MAHGSQLVSLVPTLNKNKDKGNNHPRIKFHITQRWRKELAQVTIVETGPMIYGNVQRLESTRTQRNDASQSTRVMYKNLKPDKIMKTQHMQDKNFLTSLTHTAPLFFKFFESLLARNTFLEGCAVRRDYTTNFISFNIMLRIFVH